MTSTRKGSPVLSWGREKLVDIFGADLRSLAAFRVVLAVLALADLALRAADLTAHYTDEGVLPRSALLQLDDLDRWALSLNLMSGETVIQALLFCAGALAALALLVGYRTRLMLVVVWVLLISIQWRNPLVVQEGDTLLRMLFFWGMLLPLGAYWSVDRARGASRQRLSTRFISVATVGLFVQIALVYWFTAALKTGDDWRVDGTAIYYALSVDEWTTPIGAYVYQFPSLLQTMTFATIGFETYAVFLLFFPFFTGPVRTGAAFAFMGFHIGIWLMMNIGIFSWISALCMVCFLPAWFWDKVAKLPGRRAAVGWIQTLRSRLSAGAGTVSHDETPAGLETLRASLVINLLAAFSLLFVVGWNLTAFYEIERPQRVAAIGYALGLEQGWGVFAPNVTHYNNWYVFPGTLSSGQQIDLMPAAIREDFSAREGVSLEKPEDVRNTFKNKYWRKYLSSIREESRAYLRPYLAAYICRQWNARHTGADQLVDLQLIVVEETTLPDYRRTTPEETVLLDTVVCNPRDVA